MPVTSWINLKKPETLVEPWYLSPAPVTTTTLMPIKVGFPFSVMIKGPPLSPPSREGPLEPDGG